MTDEPLLFPAATALKPSQHRERMVRLLKAYAKAGASLADVAREHISGRSITTLKRYCSLHGIAFPDYIPRYMKPKKPRIKRKQRQR